MKKILLTALVLAGFSATAQVKVGSNPTTLATDANFQVEGTTTAEQFVVLKNGNVGIGLILPKSKLDVDNINKTLPTFGSNNVSYLQRLTYGIPQGVSGLYHGAVITTTNLANENNPSTTGDFTEVRGIRNVIYTDPSYSHTGTNDLANANEASVYNNGGGGTINNVATAYRAIVGSSGSGNINRTAIGLDVIVVEANGTDTLPHEAIGVKISNLVSASGGTTNKSWAIYSAGSFTPSFHAGNIGIGTDSPENRLHVVWPESASVAAETEVILETRSNTEGESTLTFRKSRNFGKATQVNDRLGDLSFIGHDGTSWVTTPAARIYSEVTGVSTGKISGNFKFDTTEQNGVTSTKMIITNDGNVGIGTTTPTSKLQVVGLPTHADNAAALGAGLTVGAFYHVGDGIVRVVF